MSGHPDDPKSIVETRLGEILGQISDSGDPFAAGSVSAVTLALSASLVASVASTLPEGEAPAAVVAQAETLRERALELSGRNRRDFGNARSALTAKAHEEDGQLRQALERTLEDLHDLSGCAADVATLSAAIANLIDASFAPDLLSAVALAEAVAGNALRLAEANLLHLPGRPVTGAIQDDLKITVAVRDRMQGEVQVRC